MARLTDQVKDLIAHAQDLRRELESKQEHKAIVFLDYGILDLGLCLEHVSTFELERLLENRRTHEK